MQRVYDKEICLPSHYHHTTKQVGKQKTRKTSWQMVNNCKHCISFTLGKIILQCSIYLSCKTGYQFYRYPNMAKPDSPYSSYHSHPIPVQQIRRISFQNFRVQNYKVSNSSLILPLHNMPWNCRDWNQSCKFTDAWGLPNCERPLHSHLDKACSYTDLFWLIPD